MQISCPERNSFTFRDLAWQHGSMGRQPGTKAVVGAGAAPASLAQMSPTVEILAFRANEREAGRSLPQLLALK